MAKKNIMLICKLGHVYQVSYCGCYWIIHCEKVRIVEVIVGSDSVAFYAVALVCGNNHPTDDNFFMELKLHILISFPFHLTESKEHSRALNVKELKTEEHFS